MSEVTSIEWLKSVETEIGVITPRTEITADRLLSEGIVSPSKYTEVLETARWNASVIQLGIGLTYEDGFLVLRHKSTERRFRGSAVERWETLTEDDREFCLQLMD